MPLINYTCECNFFKNKLFRNPKESPNTIKCEKCGKDMKKNISSPSNSHKIIIDDGFMAKSIEIIPDIVEINQQRSIKNHRDE